ncbi:hypothetical protein, conserved [Eimeria tenella]|uniref:Peptidase M3A/M3B catalytic domain-containing protein n=1 Tax=Eimeria tenella TaxID=5802 RepID=U6L125_EIMTE|nr:hypothetical protein, conserved [Eimeria tenella]CDJ42299.1 hypothetical protein, conserved [Eimeria tenella]|eukprot:XP_013233049.1 hypothetical protein, conserved [Eimeria tenella]
MQARLLDLQELKVLAHELGHAFKEMLQEDADAFVKERPLDFDETFALLNEHILRQPEFLMSLSKHKDKNSPLTLAHASNLGFDLLDLLHPNSLFVAAAVDYAVHTLDAATATTDTLERTIKAAIEAAYSGALVCYVLAEARALRILQQLEKQHLQKQHKGNRGKNSTRSNKGMAAADLTPVRFSLFPLHPKQAMKPLMADIDATAATLVNAYCEPKRI